MNRNLKRELVTSMLLLNHFKKGLVQTYKIVISCELINVFEQFFCVLPKLLPFGRWKIFFPK